MFQLVLQSGKPLLSLSQVKGRAVGFISLTTEVDADLLNSCYQLGPFHGLRYPSETNDQLSAGEQSQRIIFTICYCCKKILIAPPPASPLPPRQPTFVRITAIGDEEECGSI